MKNQMELFKFDTQEVRVLIHEETQEPWWVASDVCRILELSDVYKTVSRLDDDEKLVRKLFVSGQNRQVTLINEAGLYGLVLTSNKPQAKQFKRWIKHEVLPSIRKTGSYGVAPQLPTDPKKLMALALIEADKTIKAQEEVIKELAPKASFHDAVTDATNAQTICAAAKALGKGRNYLYEWLRDKKYLIGSGAAKNQPYQQHITAGLFKVVEKVFHKSSGETEVYIQTLITGKGLTKIQKHLASI